MDKGAFVPLHYQLVKEIEAKITSGKLGQGDFLGTEKSLMEQYGVSCTTLRRALQYLVQSGYVYRKAGKGTFIRRVKLDNNSSPLYSFMEEMESIGLKPTTRLLAVNTMRANEFVAKNLEISKSSTIYTIKKLLEANSMPIAVWESYWPFDIGKRLVEHDLDHHLFDTLENKLRINIGEAKAEFEAALATPEEAELIGIAEDSPMLIMRRLIYSVSGHPILFSRTAYRGDRYTFRIGMVRSKGMWTAGINQLKS